MSPQYHHQTGHAIHPSQRRAAGNAQEQLAARYLEEQGLQLIERNYHCRVGEIDLIMRHNNTLVFVEVRYRNRHDFMTPATSVNHRKQQKLLRTAQVYLKHHGLTDKIPCRIDVLGIHYLRSSAKLQYDWIVNAIQNVTR